MSTEAIPSSTLEVRLAARPTGPQISPSHFSIAEVPLGDPGPGGVIVRNDYVCIGAVTRDLMDETTALPIPTFKVGEGIWARGVGTVVLSNSPELAVGDLVEHFFGAREYAAGPAQMFHKRDRNLLPGAEYYLSQGVTAWHGLVDTVGVREGDVVYVSGAGGGVGSLAGQVAKNLGAAKVIGSAGSKEKVEYLIEELGYDAAFNYREGSVAANIHEHAPDGISVFFDNVGGDQFEAALQNAQYMARFALCGSLAGQAGVDNGGNPRIDLMTVISRAVSLRGFAAMHTPEQIDGWNKQFGTWLQEGKIVYPKTIVQGGLTAFPEAQASFFGGKYTGIVALKLS